MDTEDARVGEGNALMVNRIHPIAFSTANDIGLPCMTTEEQPPSYTLECINDHYFDDIYEAVVQAIEEAVLNAMIAAETMTLVKPTGYAFEAIDHGRLMEIMKQYNRL